MPETLNPVWKERMFVFLERDMTLHFDIVDNELDGRVPGSGALMGSGQLHFDGPGLGASS